MTKSILVAVAVLLLASSAQALLRSPHLVHSAKRGLADKYEQCENWNSTKGLDAEVAFNWTYNWGPQLCGDIPMADFVPMVWGSGTLSKLDQQNTTLPPRQGGQQSPSYLLGFNEPNNQHQSNIAPHEAAKLWPKVEHLAKRWGVPKIGAPAPAGGASNHALAWLTEFFGNCTGCQVDFLTMHYYGCDVTDFKANLGLFETNFPDKKIWVTEFNCHLAKGPISRQEDYMRQAVPMLEAHPTVERYAWMAGDNKRRDKHFANLITVGEKTGIRHLTKLGKLYLSL